MKLMKVSGNPIEPNDEIALNKELNAHMDTLETTIGKCTTENAEEYQKMLRQMCSHFEDTYPMLKKMPYPHKKATMRELCNKYGTIAFCYEGDGELVMYIMDQ